MRRTLPARGLLNRCSARWPEATGVLSNRSNGFVREPVAKSGFPKREIGIEPATLSLKQRINAGCCALRGFGRHSDAGTTRARFRTGVDAVTDLCDSACAPWRVTRRSQQVLGVVEGLDLACLLFEDGGIAREAGFGGGGVGV